MGKNGLQILENRQDLGALLVGDEIFAEMPDGFKGRVTVIEECVNRKGIFARKIEKGFARDIEKGIRVYLWPQITDVTTTTVYTKRASDIFDWAREIRNYAEGSEAYKFYNAIIEGEN